jgi:hypothetical protein
VRTDTHTILVALYAAILGALRLPLSETTRRALKGAACSLARDLGLEAPVKEL